MEKFIEADIEIYLPRHSYRCSMFLQNSTNRITIQFFSNWSNPIV